jgi:4-alpha-glucanotransferase
MGVAGAEPEAWAHCFSTPQALLPAATPYAFLPLSDFTDPLLVSPERLVEDGLLSPAALGAVPDFPTGRVDFAAVARFKEALLREAWDRFRREGSEAARDRFRTFAVDSRHAPWLGDWELFRALRDREHGAPWHRWPAALARREPAALEDARRELLVETGFHRFVQFVLRAQWARLRGAASQRRIRILGDLPIYVAHDSADVWAHQALFDLDEAGEPRNVAGVPPDYFSATGQRWGNPLYRWDVMAEDGYAWWIDRLRASLELADLVRIDHFRAFASYWRVPASEATALVGEWVAGPGVAFFTALKSGLGGLPIIAEDLGTATPDVEELRERTGLAGMKVLQFAFDEDDSVHLPHHHTPRSVVYTGTHDNDTTVGWFRHLGTEAKARLTDYLGRDAEGPNWLLIRAAFTSASDLAVVPMQDVLGLGSAARVNVPGRAAGNWGWRVPPGLPRGDEPGRLRRLAQISGRLVPEDPPEGAAVDEGLAVDRDGA